MTDYNDEKKQVEEWERSWLKAKNIRETIDTALMFMEYEQLKELKEFMVAKGMINE